MSLTIFNVDFPENKNISVALSCICGIGKKFKKNSRVRKVLEKLNISPLLKVKDLSNEQMTLINLEIRQFKLEDDLKQEKEQNIEILKLIRCYRGLRHSGKKKVRGQRTHSNNRTRSDGKGGSVRVKAMAVAGKKEAPKQG
jgi:small subunit ribosomal protein S13